MAKIPLNGCDFDSKIISIYLDFAVEQTNEEGNLTSIEACFKVAIILNEYRQSNLSTTCTLGTKESGHRGEGAVMGR